MFIASTTLRRPAHAHDGAEGLRLALFSGNYNYTRDGANQALNRLVSYLLREGAAVRVYSPTTHTPAFEPAGDLVSVPSVGIPGRSEYRVALGLPRATREDLARFAPTAIHLSAPDLLNLAARNLARRQGIPVAVSVHTRFETYLSYYGLGWLRPAAEAYLNGFYGGCDRVLAPNRPIAELLRGQGLGSRVGVWGRGVDRVQFQPTRRDPQWRRDRGIPDTATVVVFLGRLVAEKGLDAFAESLTQARRQGADLRAVIIGDGPARARFQAELPGAVFTGQLTGAALARALASGDVLLNPSRTEAFGNATLEAMASGLAVVCPEAPSTSQLVTSGLDGLLVGSPEPAAYAAALHALAADPDRRRDLGMAARRRSADFDWDAVCAEVLAVYRGLGAVPARRRAWA